MNTKRTGLLLALATASISGVSVFLNGYGVKTFGDAGLYTTAKNLVAALVLIVVATSVAGSHDRVFTRPANSASWAGLLAVGVIGGAIPFLLFFEGLSRSSSTQAAFLHKTLVVWVAVLALPFLGERVGRWHWLAIAFLIAGQAAMTGDVSAPLRMPWGSGESMVLAATVMWSVEVVVAKRLLGSLSPWTVGVTRMTLGSVLLVVWAAANGKAGALLRMDAEQFGWVVLTGVLLAGYVGTWFAALARARAVDVTAVLVAGAVITAGLSAAVNGTRLQPQLGGVGLVLVGTALALWRMREAARTQVA